MQEKPPEKKVFRPFKINKHSILTPLNCKKQKGKKLTTPRNLQMKKNFSVYNKDSKEEKLKYLGEKLGLKNKSINNNNNRNYSLSSNLTFNKREIEKENNKEQNQIKLRIKEICTMTDFQKIEKIKARDYQNHLNNKILRRMNTSLVKTEKNKKNVFNTYLGNRVVTISNYSINNEISLPHNIFYCLKQKGCKKLYNNSIYQNNNNYFEVEKVHKTDNNIFNIPFLNNNNSINSENSYYLVNDNNNLYKDFIGNENFFKNKKIHYCFSQDKKKLPEINTYKNDIKNNSQSCQQAKDKKLFQYFK